MFTAALVCGAVPPPIDQPFRYLDLACGNGLTLAIIADAYPHAEFVGIDINPDHINRAKERSQQAGLTNIAFFEGDVQDVDANQFGQFDYCAVSGVYSWIDKARRDKTRIFISDVVRRGGLVYLDYSSQPGMAQAAPLYRLLRDVGDAQSGSSAEKLTAAARFTDQMRRNGARFFETNPVATGRLQAILENPPEDEAHEVFNLQGAGFWSGDVINDMEEHGLNFLANAGLHQNLPQLTARPDAMKAYADFPVALQQTCFDMTWNVHQRRDIYIKGETQGEKGALVKALENIPCYAMPNALSVEHRRSLAETLPNYDFCTEDASKFADAAATAGTFGALFDRLSAGGIDAETSTELARHFLAARLLSVAAATPLASEGDGDVEMGSALNCLILVEDIGSEHARPFASPVAGSRVLLPLKDRLYLWGLIGLDLGEAWEKLSGMQQIFRDTQNNQLTRESFIQTIEDSLPGFRQHIVPELLRLKILRPLEDHK
ncbi:MAG: hypothetical protein COA68_15505 [Oceanobacter sp.]|nr:MAG: hypothetical protein COA68_15505 [Oceanobacter sp.]